MTQMIGLVVTCFGLYGAYKWIKEKGPTPWGKNLFEEREAPKDELQQFWPASSAIAGRSAQDRGRKPVA